MGASTPAMRSCPEKIAKRRKERGRGADHRAVREELQPILDTHAHGARRGMEEAAVRKGVEDRPARMEHRRGRKRRNAGVDKRVRKGLRRNRDAGRRRGRCAGDFQQRRLFHDCAGCANCRWYNGYTTDQPSEFVWNASISKQILRRQATIALRANDILGQSRAQNIAITDNYYQETRNNTIGRYIMLTFTWRFGTFGGGRNRRGNFRPGAGGPPMGAGGPPMGGFGGGRF